jgi:hypothetical protein
MKHIANARLGIALTRLGVGLITLVAVQSAWAGIDPQPFRTGLFGVTAGQSIRISIVNAGAAGGVINPCVHVWDASGALLVEIAPGPILEGRGTFVDFTPAPSGTPVRGRAQVRAEVVFEHGVHPPDPAFPPEPVLVSVEVFDTATGQTVFTIQAHPPDPIYPPDPIFPPDPVYPPDPVQPFKTGLFGVGAGQSIRVSVVNAGDLGGIINPCMRVLDLEGTVLSEVDGGPLPAGGGTFADFDLAADPTRAPGFRAQMRVEVELLPAVLPPDLAPGLAMAGTEIHLTLEVYDTATGRTVFTMPFAAVGFNPQPEPPEPVLTP